MLQYVLICNIPWFFWGTKTQVLRKFQVKQNYIVRIISYKSKRKTKFKPLYGKFHFLNVEGVFKLETAKFMVKLNTNKRSNIFTKKLLK